MKIKINRETVYSADELAKTLNISRRMVTLMVQEGKLPSTKIGRKYAWTGSAILEALSK